MIQLYVYAILLYICYCTVLMSRIVTAYSLCIVIIRTAIDVPNVSTLVRKGMKARHTQTIFRSRIVPSPCDAN